MKPIVIEMVEVLLKKGETVKMTTSFHGNTLDCVVRSVERYTSASQGSDGYYFHCDFHDDLIEETQECEERRTDCEVELMTLKKYGANWHLF
jgi:hypothetical protein